MLTKRNNYILQVLILVFVLGCNAEKKQKEILVAKVGNSELTQRQLNKTLNTDVTNLEKKEEVVRNWVETELLLQAAKENDLLNENNFERIIKQSERKLAASYAMKNYLVKNSKVISEKELRKYYKIHKSDYELPTDGYILNFISFGNLEDAILFRSSILKKKWKLAKNKLKNQNNIVKSYSDKLIKVSDINSKKLLRVLKELRKKETSIVIETELSNFVVVQLLEKVSKNEVPKLKYVKEKVRAIYQAQINKELVRNYINGLTTKKNVKIY
ncbi:MAG: peptidyl-prolyl cis-trans isomerase [Melioribacteraceae bacterium]